jgi:hypothetical protein
MRMVKQLLLKTICINPLQMNAGLTPQQADKVLPLHQENAAHVHSAMMEIMALAQEQIQVLESTELRLVTVDEMSVAECIIALTDSTRLHERDVMSMAEQTTKRLEQASQLGRLQVMAAQVWCL